MSIRTTQLAILIFVSLILLTISKPAENGCEISLSNQHYLFKAPLVFKPIGELYATTTASNNGESKILIENGAEVLFSCGPNYFKKFKRVDLLRLVCNGATGNFTPITSGRDNKSNEIDEMSYTQLSCDLRVIEQVNSPVNGCNHEKWTSTSFGYIHPTEHFTYIIGEACYDMTEGRTLFAHVKLGEKTANYLHKVGKDFLTRHSYPSDTYKIELFRGLSFDDIYERIRTQLHIKTAPEMSMTNFIDDALLSDPQYSAIKKLAWNYYVVHDELKVLATLKQDIKQLSKNLNLDVYVGSHGVNVLHGTNGEKMEVYLHEGGKKRFPMPELIWFVVQHEQKAIAFAVFNDPDANAVQNDNPNSLVSICNSDCSKITWLSETLKETVNRKPLICCDYANFKIAIKEVPALGNVNQMLL